jgi:6-pyruvoyltetrahydropterin/6-carboxytetrahydropterin synthase
MNTVRVSKIFRFETAHVLDNYDGKCSNLHGHSYELVVTVIGKPIEDKNNVKCGMVIDFSDLKKIVKTHIVDVFDHALVIRDDSRFKGIESNHTQVIYKPYQPTAENMVIDFAQILKRELPKGIELKRIALMETATSIAEWCAEDN